MKWLDRLVEGKIEYDMKCEEKIDIENLSRLIARDFGYKETLCEGYMEAWAENIEIIDTEEAIWNFIRNAYRTGYDEGEAQGYQKGCQEQFDKNDELLKQFKEVE